LNLWGRLINKCKGSLYPACGVAVYAEAYAEYNCR